MSLIEKERKIQTIYNTSYPSDKKTRRIARHILTEYSFIEHWLHRYYKNDIFFFIYKDAENTYRIFFNFGDILDFFLDEPTSSCILPTYLYELKLNKDVDLTNAQINKFFPKEMLRTANKEKKQKFGMESISESPRSLKRKFANSIDYIKQYNEG